MADQSKLEAAVPVTDAQLQAAYNQNKDQYRTPERVKVRHILLKTTDKPAADEPKIKAKAEDLLKQLKAGGNFADLAKKYSEDTGTAKNGGSLGWIKPDAFPAQQVSKAVASLAKGATSEVIDAGYAFVILHV